ncbi:MAG: hypothetical protein Q4F69_11580 [Bacteroidia bacterium]|nr:hypothetical protein [Bacteroidia bacterium]
MKKFSLIISALALVLGLAQCAKKPNMPTFNGGYAGVTKEVTFSTGTSGDGSKVTIDNSILEELLHYKWENTDVIHVYGSQMGDFTTDGQYCGVLKLNKGEGTEDGVFKGILNNVPTTGKLRFYYFGGGNNGATIDLSTQNGRIDNGDASLNKKIVARAEETVSGSEYDKDLEVLYSIIKFDFHNFGACDLTMKGTKNNSFYINEHGVMVETAGTTTTLKGVTAEPGPYYVAVLPTDVEKFNFAGNGKVGSKTPTQPLEANYFYTDNGASYVIEVETAADAPSVETHVCVDCAYAVGGVVSSTTPQYCEYGVVYAKASDIADPADLVIGGANCTKFEENNSDVTNEAIDYTVDLEDLVDGVKYIVKAYAIGENNTPVYGNAMVFTASKPMPTGWTNATSPYSFSVASGKAVYFSQGNLQYVATGTHAVAGGEEDGTWRFAEHQFDVIGNSQATDAMDVDRDLFGWGTSGYHQSTDGNNKHYLPYSTSNMNYGYGTNSFGYGPSTNAKPEGPSPSTGNVSGSYYDWGVYNDISNDGSLGVGSWRTLTGTEWTYLLGRTDGSGNLLYGEVKLTCTNGLVILPDNWDWSKLSESLRTFTSGASDWSNVYSYSEWHEMELNGAVFLPVGGYRYGTPIIDGGSSGRYWSGTSSGSGNSVIAQIKSGSVTTFSSDRCGGYSVRLVRDAE